MVDFTCESLGHTIFHRKKKMAPILDRVLKLKIPNVGENFLEIFEKMVAREFVLSYKRRPLLWYVQNFLYPIC